MTAAAEHLSKLASGDTEKRPLLEIGAALVSSGPAVGRGVPGANPAGRRLDPDAWHWPWKWVVQDIM